MSDLNFHPDAYKFKHKLPRKLKKRLKKITSAMVETDIVEGITIKSGIKDGVFWMDVIYGWGTPQLPKHLLNIMGAG